MDVEKKEYLCTMNLFKNIINWYFTKRALPYWAVLMLDVLICYISCIFTFWLFYRGAVTLGNIAILNRTIVVYLLFNLVGFRVFHTYSGVIRYSSFVDLQRVAMAMGLSCCVAILFHYVIYPYNTALGLIPLRGKLIVVMYIIATILMWGLRVLIKTLYDVSFSSEDGMRTLIYGVQDGGVALAKQIRNEKPTRFQLKGFITHDPSYSSKMLMGEKVYAVNSQLGELLKDQHIQAVLVSPKQNERFREDQELQEVLIAAGVKMYMMAETREVKNVNGVVDVEASQLKEVSVEDLLPREQIQVDMKAIGTLLCGRKILITGSAGSIGSEMVRQIAQFGPAQLILIDQAETPQHDIRLMMAKQWPQIRCHTIVTSIVNEERMEHIFRQFRPDYVFHAAAYKHVPMMEDNPSESVQNNIYGTKIIADLSMKYGVRKFVMISTDKAVNPTNVMGCSKRICEIYVQALNNANENGNVDRATLACQSKNDGQVPLVCQSKNRTQFVTTRFGNVLGSNGSVIPLFERQIKAGGPVTVTDPKIIRFFMLIPEACKLVLEAGTHGKGGEIFVFDMGKPVRIADLARRMIALSGAKNVEIKYTGLREGEKLYEEVLSNTENTLPSFHEKIRIAKVREYDFLQVARDIDELIELAKTYDDMEIVRKMKQIVPEYKSNNSKYEQLDRS